MIFFAVLRATCHLDLSGLSIGLQIVVFQPVVSQDQILLSETQNSK